MKRILFFLIIFSSFSVIANDKSKAMDALVNSFILCDSTFFSTLSTYKTELENNTPFEQVNNQFAFIPVHDRTNSKKNFQLFSSPIKYKSLSITGYYDSALSLGKYGDYYFWGFIIDSSIDDIKSELNNLEWLEMEKDLLYTANAKIRSFEDNLETWHDNINNIVGVKTIPAQGTAEKLLLLEKSPEITLLVCSVQGFYPPELLEIIRPELPQKQINSN